VIEVAGRGLADPGAAFEAVHPCLFGIAYRILGTSADDIDQVCFVVNPAKLAPLAAAHRA
jgi:hypothetical protein